MEKKFTEVNRAGQIITYTVSDRLTELSKKKRPPSKKLIEANEMLKANETAITEFMARHSK